MNSVTERVVVISASVLEEAQQVLWLVERPNGDHYPLRWPIDKFGSAMNIQATFSAKQLQAECEKLVGKTINLVFRGKEHEDQNIR